MKRFTVCLSVFVLSLFVLSISALAKPPNRLEITNATVATVDLENDTIYIYGLNFGDDPEVWLADNESPLEVQSSSDTQITASLPKDIQPGTYRLMVAMQGFDPSHPEKADSLGVTIGTVGPKGDKGNIGETGPTGPQGPQGEQGETGPTGPQGVAGPQGDKGDKGDTGATGPKGDKGDTGATGPVGLQGPKGDKGDTGDIGPQGIAGPQGDKGDKGDTGATGPKGDKGDTGDTGPVGLQGPKGDKGDTGNTGPQGYTGPAGPQGLQGEQGLPGECDCPITQEQLDNIYARIEYIESLLCIRFTDMGDGTIRDNNTGLIWLKNANCFGFMNWDAAMVKAALLAHDDCGLTDGSESGDWGLPTKEEWKAFYSTAYDNPALVNTIGYAQWSEGDAFTSVQSEHYWSSTEYDSDRAWFVDMDIGEMYDTGYKYFNMYVWPVRSGND